MRKLILAATSIVVSVSANAQDIKDPQGAFKDAFGANLTDLEVSNAIKSFRVLCVIHDNNENYAEFRRTGQPVTNCDVGGRKIVVRTDFGGYNYQSDLQGFTVYEDLTFRAYKETDILHVPPCVHGGSNHTEYEKPAGAFLYRWCEPDPVPSGQTNEDLLMYIGGSFRLVGSRLVFCNTLPQDVQNSDACDGQPAP